MEDLVRQTQKVIMLTLPGKPGDDLHDKCNKVIHHSTMEAADLIVVSWSFRPDTFYVVKHRHKVLPSNFGWSRDDMNLMLKEYYEQVIESEKMYNEMKRQVDWDNYLKHNF